MNRTRKSARWPFIVIVAMVALLLLPGTFCGGLRAEEIDRVVARIENDVILLSDVRALSRYQQLVDGKSESDAQILDRLIDQWVVRSEAETSRFPRPSDTDAQRAVEHLKKSFASPEEYQARQKTSGLTDAQIQQMAAEQLYLTNYLDSRFRPAVHIDPKAVEDFYNQGVVVRAKERGETPPTFEASRDYIQEVLIQQGITEEANHWLNESRDRIHVEKFLNGPS
jgi:hypothetical protein